MAKRYASARRNPMTPERIKEIEARCAAAMKAREAIMDDSYEKLEAWWTEYITGKPLILKNEALVTEVAEGLIEQLARQDIPALLAALKEKDERIGELGESLAWCLPQTQEACAAYLNTLKKTTIGDDEKMKWHDEWQREYEKAQQLLSHARVAALEV